MNLIWSDLIKRQERERERVVSHFWLFLFGDGEDWTSVKNVLFHSVQMFTSRWERGEKRSLRRGKECSIGEKSSTCPFLLSFLSSSVLLSTFSSSEQFQSIQFFISIATTQHIISVDFIQSSIQRWDRAEEFFGWKETNSGIGRFFFFSFSFLFLPIRLTKIWRDLIVHSSASKWSLDEEGDEDLLTFALDFLDRSIDSIQWMCQMDHFLSNIFKVFSFHRERRTQMDRR